MAMDFKAQTEQCHWRTLSLPERHKFLPHLTVSGIVIVDNQILLVHHKRLSAWLPPGGHVEPTELPHEAVVREVLEETGYAVDVVSRMMPATGDPDAFFLPTPLCVHAVRAKEAGQNVYHVDIAYLCRRAKNSQNQGKGDTSSQDQMAATIQLTASSMGDSGVNAAIWMPVARISELPLAKNVIEIVTLATSELAPKMI